MATTNDFTLHLSAVTAGRTATVTLDRPSAQYSITAAVCTFGGRSEAVSLTLREERDATAIYSWDVPLSWCERIVDAVSAAASLSVQIAFDSAIDALDDPNVCTLESAFTLYVPESVRPTATVQCSIVNEEETAQSWGLALQGRSRIAYTVTAAGQQGATVTDCTFTFGVQQLTGFSGRTQLLTTAGQLTPTATVTDSRGRSTTVSTDPITVWPYHLPTVSGISVLRCTQSGTVDRNGAYLKVSAAAKCAAVDGRNSVSLTVRIRPMGGDWGSAVTLENAVAKVLSASAEAVYEAEFTATDSLGLSRSVTACSGTAAAAFHLRAGGDGAAFGKRAEAAGFHCAWDAAFDGAVSVNGGLTTAALTVGGKSLLDLVYPVGAVYMSLRSDDPATLFGGTWSPISGRFLLGASDTYPAVSTGGAATRTLTTAQLPAHSHRVVADTDATSVGHQHTIPNIKSGASGEYGVYAESWGYGSGKRELSTDFVDITHIHRVDTTSQTTGSGASFSILPPYLSVYMWRRTA